MGLWDKFLDWIRSIFFKQEMELTLVGLQNSGKTTLTNVISSGQEQQAVDAEDSIPTIGFNMRKVQRGNVTIKLWDIGGQKRFRGMWERYCRRVNAIVFVTDSSDKESLPDSLAEFQDLVAKTSASSIPILLLGNKNDLPGCLTLAELVDYYKLSEIKNREVGCYSISAKNGNNINETLKWLMKYATSKKPEE